jgi:hypothetical protein
MEKLIASYYTDYAIQAPVSGEHKVHIFKIKMCPEDEGLVFL